jgi:hypothetical protein
MKTCECKLKDGETVCVIHDLCLCCGAGSVQGAGPIAKNGYCYLCSDLRDQAALRAFSETCKVAFAGQFGPILVGGVFIEDANQVASFKAYEAADAFMAQRFKPSGK